MSYNFTKTNGHFAVEPQYSGLVAAKLRQIGYDWEFDENGRIEDTWPKCETLGNEFDTFKEIAKYVDEGCFLEFRGEDGSMWRWIFDGKSCQELNAVLTWPDIPEKSAPKVNNGDSVFSAAQSRADHCPMCGSDSLEYEASSTNDDSVEYPWECKNCHHKGVEYGNIVFDGHRVFDCTLGETREASDDQN